MNVNRSILACSTTGLYVLNQSIIEVVSYDNVAIGNVEALFGNRCGEDAVQLALLELEYCLELVPEANLLAVPTVLGIAAPDLLGSLVHAPSEAYGLAVTHQDSRLKTLYLDFGLLEQI